MNESKIVHTHNGYGWTSTVPNQITLALVEWLKENQRPSPLVLDIGAGMGVGTLPFLEAGAEADVEAGGKGGGVKGGGGGLLRTQLEV